MLYIKLFWGLKRTRKRERKYIYFPTMAHALEDENKDKKIERKKSVDVIDVQSPPPPDGGWGWLVVFASFMIHVVSE